MIETAKIPNDSANILSDPILLFLPSGSDIDRWTQFSVPSFALSCGPLGLDLDAPLSSHCVVAKAAPLPVFRTFVQREFPTQAKKRLEWGTGRFSPLGTKVDYVA
jgi:hypothetical protein